MTQPAPGSGCRTWGCWQSRKQPASGTNACPKTNLENEGPETKARKRTPGNGEFGNERPETNARKRTSGNEKHGKRRLGNERSETKIRKRGLGNERPETKARETNAPPAKRRLGNEGRKRTSRNEGSETWIPKRSFGNKDLERSNYSFKVSAQSFKGESVSRVSDAIVFFQE